MAQSLYKELPLQATKCSEVCPHYTVFQIANQLAPLDRRTNTPDQPDSILFGMDIPERWVIFIQDKMNSYESRVSRLNISVLKDPIAWQRLHHPFVPNI